MSKSQMTAEEELETFWREFERMYDAETRTEVEIDARRNWSPPSAVAAAMHLMWKRNPKIAPLVKELDELREFLRVERLRADAFFNGREALKTEIKQLRTQVIGMTWECGCGAMNGVNLADCAVCRKPRWEGGLR